MSNLGGETRPGAPGRGGYRGRLFAAVLAPLVLAAACATSPLGRSQIKLYSEADMAEMGRAAFAEMRREKTETRSAPLNEYVDCITDAITATLPQGPAWEVAVFDDESVNAFALPGGKIGIYTGMLDVARNQHQLAAVIAHEIGHVLSGHANERMSASTLSTVGMQVAAAIAGAPSGQRDTALAALGLGVQVGVLLPFSRTQEQEADLIGLELMADAGFDPRESIDLWRNMQAEERRSPPEFLSTHPSSRTRIEALEDRMPGAMAAFESARAAGRRPGCSD